MNWPVDLEACSQAEMDAGQKYAVLELIEKPGAASVAAHVDQQTQRAQLSTLYQSQRSASRPSGRRRQVLSPRAT